jgi:hypothetical protein
MQEEVHVLLSYGLDLGRMHFGDMRGVKEMQAMSDIFRP